MSLVLLGSVGGYMMPDPLYRQIAEDLRQRIESGQLGHGDQLPTELELRERYDASRNTVRDAVKWLTTRGLIQTRPGQGTFVAEKIDPFVTSLTVDPATGRDDEGPVYLAEVTARLRKPTLSDPRVEIQQASAVIASELRLAEGSTVVSRSQRRYIDETPWSLQTSFYPMALVERGALKLIQAVNIGEGTVAYLAAELGPRAGLAVLPAARRVHLQRPGELHPRRVRPPRLPRGDHPAGVRQVA